MGRLVAGDYHTVLDSPYSNLPARWDTVIKKKFLSTIVSFCSYNITHYIDKYYRITTIGGWEQRYCVAEVINNNKTGNVASPSRVGPKVKFIKLTA